MSLSNKEFDAESHGLVIGRQRGFQEGVNYAHQASYADGWNAAMEDCDGDFARLNRQISDLRFALENEKSKNKHLVDDVNGLLAVTANWRHAFGSLVTLLIPALDAIGQNPVLKAKFVGSYVAKLNEYLGNGSLKSYPWNDHYVKEQPAIAERVKGWITQAVNLSNTKTAVTGNPMSKAG